MTNFSVKVRLISSGHHAMQDLVTEHKYLTEDSVPGNLNRSIQIRHDNDRESSFNAADPLLSQIKELMQTPYCGTISFRSNNSTTSSQSFAFPL